MRCRSAAAVVVCALLGCGARTPRGRVDAGATAPVTGLYWGRWGDVEEGVRVAVWTHGDGHTVRGAWDMPPWHGELAGRQDGDRLTLEWREQGVVAVHQLRARDVTLTRDRHGAWRGGVGDAAVELLPAGHPSPALHPGLWLGRWTGLPAGLAVETVLTHEPDGVWRAAYHYQGREGSFEGALGPDGALTITWREVVSEDRIAQGRGRMAPSPTGVRGTFGVAEAVEGVGQWSLEPFGGP